MDLGYMVADRTYTKKCPVCGEEFRYYPRWHQWLIRKGSEHIAVCRYNCMRKVERAAAEKEAEREKRMEERARTKGKREYEIRKKMADEPILRDKPPDWYKAQMDICRSVIAEVNAEIERMQESGEWAEITAGQRKRRTGRVSYHTKKLQRLQEGLEIVLKQQKERMQEE